jgi:inhibitor of nuclear factor kappa-B kinase subunit alpha
VELTDEENLHGWFQQDSATDHTVWLPMQAVSNLFRKRIISSGIWQAYSPEMNPCDFFFWGCLKDKVYKSNPQMEQELKENIHREIVNISAEQFQRVKQNLFHQCEKYLHAEGQHFQHLP